MDTFKDLYKIPVDFVPGQQPTAKFLNNWADQIDESFMLLSEIIGDFDGKSVGEDTYLPNITRAIGSSYWVTTRLPGSLKVSAGVGGGENEDLPLIKESLAAYEGEREVLLSFLPAVSLPNNDIENTGLGIGVAIANDKGEGFNLQGGNLFSLRNRRLITGFKIEAGDTITYPVDTGSSEYPEGHGDNIGSNTVPSVYEIFSNLAALCVLSQPEGYGPQEYRIDFPTVRRIMNPSKPFSFVEADTIKLDDELSPVKWDLTGNREAPKYRIPANILNLVEGTSIPKNMVSLWFKGEGGAYRLRPPVDGDLFEWNTIPGTINAIKLTVSPDFEFPDGASPGEGQANQYIVGFAGTSITKMVNELNSHMVAHKHDGTIGGLVSARDLADKFNPDEYAFSVKKYNHFPQYLLRHGYDSTDIRARYNSLLGSLFISRVSATPSTPEEEVSGVDENSHALLFGSSFSGPRLYFNASDTEGPDDGKLNIDRKAVRAITHLYIGDTEYSSYLATTGEGAEERLVHHSSNDGGVERQTIFETGALHLRGGWLYFNDPVDDVLGLVYGEYDVDRFVVGLLDTTNEEHTSFEATSFRARLITGDTFTHRIPLTSTAGGLSGMTHPTPGITGDDLTVAAPRLESFQRPFPDMEELSFWVSIPHPKTIGLEYQGSIGIKGAKVYVVAYDADISIENPTGGVLRTVRVNNSLPLNNVTVLQESLSPPDTESGDSFNRVAWSTNPATPAVVINTNSEYLIGCSLYIAPGTQKFGVDGIEVTYEVL